MIYCRRSVTPIDRMRIREVLVHSHGLTWCGDDSSQLDRSRIEGGSTWSYQICFSVIVDVAETGLIG